MTRRPLLLHATAGDGVVAVRVEILAGTAFSGSYRLEVEAGGNRSTHQLGIDTAHAENVVLSNIAIGHASGTPWRATLTVERTGGEGYVERAGS